ncbi:MAG: DivIVA domain-containing protein [Eubacteriales bacterium]|nr:DivIVA domain-containing protein [Eubacteriales bacterium]
MRTDEIVNKVFTRSFMGYDIEQVDLFLDEVIEAMERYEAEKREMLSAMEYLMKKLEHGQKMPLSDMKKAIDSDRSQAKASLPEGTEGRDEEPKTARSIARSGASKPIRAPKISRVKGEENAKAQIIEEAKSAIPQQELTQEEADKRAKNMSSAAVNWLDELLINISEHETSNFEKPQQPAKPASQTQTQSAKPAPQAQTQSAKPAPQPTATEQTNETTANPPESNI